ncbi:MAG: KilA-N domain-containing protein [Burkholderiales bacterium]|nr:KilA-N domain-containing protein [Burkholderiales bacterium]
MNKKTIITVKDTNITILAHNQDDYISLTDMAKGFDGGLALIEQWLRNKDTIEFLGIWERISNNQDFNSIEFEGIKNEAGTNRFYLSAKKWIETTNAIGIISKSGRYGGTYAHKDIAFEFGSWLSPEFKLYLIKEFQRLKEDENQRLSLNWDLNRTLAKINYRIHTDAIKNHLIPQELTKEQKNKTYASEADILNIALFGITAKEWREQNSEQIGNIRDYATIEQLLVLANLESLNAEFIRMHLAQADRLERLNSIAIIQLKSLLDNQHLNKLTGNKN